MPRPTPSWPMSAAGKGPRSTVSAHTAYDLATRSGEQATLRFASGHGHATKAVRDIAAFLLGAGLSPGLVEDASIALAEALNNIEEHAYSGDRSSRSWSRSTRAAIAFVAASKTAGFLCRAACFRGGVSLRRIRGRMTTCPKAGSAGPYCDGSPATWPISGMRTGTGSRFRFPDGAFLPAEGTPLGGAKPPAGIGPSSPSRPRNCHIAHQSPPRIVAIPIL
jgi:hypothetical protein